MADKQYDVTPEQQKAIQEYAQRRALLRAEYIKQITNPHRHGSGEGGTLESEVEQHVRGLIQDYPIVGFKCLQSMQFDSGIQRFMSMRVTQYDNFKPSPKTTRYGLGLVLVPILGFTFLLKYMRDKQEHLYRTGQVAYRDRKFKFI